MRGSKGASSEGGQNGPGPMHEVGPGSLIPSDPPLVRLKESFYNRGSVKGVSRKGGGGGEMVLDHLSE